MNGYVDKQYRKGTTSISCAATPQHIIISISCHILNFDNFWGGEWLSKWYLDFNNGNISGAVTIHNHYFESGNIQFNMKKDFPEQKVELTAAGVVKLIHKLEDEYQNSHGAMYGDISTKLLKGMRRVIPITRQKFDWTRPILM